jgi:hypothetical protein
MKTRDVHRTQPRRDEHLIEEEVHDPYKARKKPHAPLLCPKCGAVNVSGAGSGRKRNMKASKRSFAPPATASMTIIRLAK